MINTAITRSTERIKVKLVDDTEAEVMVFKYLTYRQAEEVKNTLLRGVKVSPGMKKDSIEVPATQLFEATSKVAEYIWADKNYTLDDVQGESLSEVVSDRFNSFLGSLGFRASAGNNKSSVPEENPEPVHSGTVEDPKNT